MQKRRVDLIESLVDQLNPQYFKSIITQMTFQLGETYNQMFEIKLKVEKNWNELIIQQYEESGDVKTPAADQKINHMYFTTNS